MITWEQSDPFFQEVSKSPDSSDNQVWDSRPSLKYVYDGFNLHETRMFRIRSAEGQRFSVLVLSSGPIGVPGDDFELAYLLDAEGKPVDWKSQWMVTSFAGGISEKLLDVNDDGKKAFCFIGRRYQESDQLLSAYCVRNNKFGAIVHKRYVSAHIEFQGNALPDGLVLQPLVEKQDWDAEIIYEIPVKISNRGSNTVDIGQAVVKLLPHDANVSSYTEAPGKEILAPGATTMRSILMAIFPDVRDQKFKFELEKSEH